VEVEIAHAIYWMGGGERHLDGINRFDKVSVGPDGSYTFPRVIPGHEYSVSVFGASTSGPAQNEAVTLASPYFPTSSAALRYIDKATTLPTLTMRSTVKVSGRALHPEGLVFPADATAALFEKDPAGNLAQVAWAFLDPNGEFEIPAGAFPGRRYTIEISALGLGTWYYGLADHAYLGVTRLAGATGLDFGSFSLPMISATELIERARMDALQLTGAPTVGSTLTLRRPGGAIGARSTTPGATVTYEWYRDGELIPGATKATYTLTLADKGKFVRPFVIVRAPGHMPRGEDFFDVLVAEGSAPFATRYPAVSGTAKVGKTLKVSKGSWSVTGTKLAYQWLRNGKAISKATKSSYTLKSADRGKRISVRITASAPGRAAGVSITPQTAKVAYGAAAKAKKKPKISGTARVGKTLKVSKGSWSLKDVKLSYQWLRNGKKITKATKSRYKLTKKDKGKKISVRVTAKKTGYKSAKVVTKATKKVKG